MAQGGYEQTKTQNVEDHELKATMHFHCRHSDVSFSLNKARALTISKFDSRRTSAKKNAIVDPHELDGYHGSDDDSESNASNESKEDLVDIAVLNRAYVSKEDIVEAVNTYYAQVTRPFKVAKSDKRRYKVVCPVDGCTFLAQFAFTLSFDRPPNLSPRSCGPEFSAQAVKRLSTAKYLMKNTELREYFLQIEQKHISPVMTQRKAQKLGLSASYMNCVNAFKRLAREFYGEDRSQYPCLPSHTAALNDRGHRARCDIVDGTFVRLAVVYQEGIQVFSQYTDRGLSIDGTFLKAVIGGTLLVACFRNGNSQLQIVGIAVVSGENQDNWGFFLRFLMTNLDAHPRFLVSDRDKGLIPAVAALDTIKVHFFCFRHLMENFNQQFKAKPLKNTAWPLVLAMSEGEFAKKATMLKRMNPEAEASCPRFGTLTSNNVESVNSALKKTRKLPIIDCTMATERYLGSKRVSNNPNSLKWEMLTHRATTRMGNLLVLNTSIQVSQHSEAAFIVNKYVKRGEHPSEFAVRLFEPSVACACGYTKDIGAPCIHSFVCLRKVGKLGAAHQYFDKTWTTSAYNRGYKQVDSLKLSPPVLKEMLTATAPHRK